MLEIKNLSYSVGENGDNLEILKDVDLTVQDGSFAVITGPNGGGKTTLAKAIMGMVKPDGGQILYNGVDITGMSITERARQGICYGFQQPPRFKGMKVSALLEIAAGRKLAMDECCQYLTSVGLCSNDYLDREVDAGLSGGEVKRIEIATILAKNGSLMIFDEPEAGIDLWSFTRLIETFDGIHKKSDSTMLVISHQERIINLADEIILVRGGKIAMQGPTKEILPHIMADTVSGCSFVS